MLDTLASTMTGPRKVIITGSEGCMSAALSGLYKTGLTAQLSTIRRYRSSTGEKFRGAR